MKYFYIILSILLFSSCTTKEKIISKPKKIEQILESPEVVMDLINIPQNIEAYTQTLASSSFSQKIFEKKYFRVWNINKSSLSLHDAMWAHRVYKEGNTYGENLQLLEQVFFDNLLNNANYDKYQTVNKKALTTQLLNIRAMPSDMPVLRDPSEAGEGFPFDYLQNSTIAANKPILISHYSKDKKWVFIESSFAYGWVKSNDIVIIDEKYTKLWQQAEQVFLTKDGIPIYSEEGDFLFMSRVGMVLALIDEDKDTYTVLTVGKYKKSKALYLKSKVDKNLANKGSLKFNSENINKILKEISKSNYGWGGIYAQRDCSSTLRDFYAPFGLWLPRNSSQQVKAGKIISLKALSNSEKLETIKKKALPFRTLIYKKGHIGLYVGTYNEQVIMYQNVWGIKTLKSGKEGRFIIGKPIFSTLEVGKNLRNFDKKSSMLQQLNSISTL